MREIEILKKAIKEAGKAVMAFYYDLEINYKEDESSVTEADLGLIRKEDGARNTTYYKSNF